MPTFNFNSTLQRNQNNEINDETKKRLENQDELIKNINEKVEILLNSHKELNDQTKNKNNILLSSKNNVHQQIDHD